MMETKFGIAVKVSNGWAMEGDIVKYPTGGSRAELVAVCDSFVNIRFEDSKEYLSVQPNVLEVVEHRLIDYRIHDIEELMDIVRSEQ